MITTYEKIKKLKNKILSIKVDSSTEEIVEIFPTAKQTIKSGTYIIIGKIISYLASFAVVITMGRFVSRETAGSYNYIISVLTIMSITTLPGMNNALIRAVSKGYDGTMHYMLRKRLIWGLLGSLICLIVGIISWENGNSTLGLAFLIAAPFIPITDTFSNFAINFWQGKKRFDKSSMIEAIYYIGLAIISIPVLILTNNLILIIGGIMIAQAIMGCLVYLPIRKNSGIVDKGSSKLGMHLTAMQILNNLSSSIDKIIVWHLLGPIMVAIYSFTITPISKAYRLIPIGTISLPHLSNQTFTKSVKKIIINKTFTLFLITIPITIIIILTASFIYKILFPLYPESIKYFKVGVLSLIFSPVLLLKSALTAFNKTKALYINNIITPIIKVALMISLTILLGLLGMIISIVVVSIFEFFLVLIMFTKTKTEKL